LRLFENNLLRRIVGPEEVEIRIEWRKLLNDKFHNLCSSLNIIKIIESRKMIQGGQTMRLEEMKMFKIILQKKPRGRNHLQSVDIGTDVGLGVWSGLIGSG
jgi:hypothetical protein